MKYIYNILILSLTIIILISLYIVLNKYLIPILHGFGTVKEGFTWSSDLIKRFNKFQTTVNDNNNQYNIDVLQEQASPEEANELLDSGYWPWSAATKYQYQDAVWRNPIIKINVSDALDYAQKTYNETAAKRVMSWNTKEGKFLLYGGKDRLNKNIIKCSSDENNDSVMQKIRKNNYIDDYIESATTIQNNDIPNEMPGFNFAKGVCNPCVALRNDYSCPFTLNVEGDNKVSPVWAGLWHI